jgi:hypothetical protein
MIGDDVGGIAVHIGARVATIAGAGEVLVSSTVKDLVAGSGLRFGDRGSHSLKGVPGEMAHIRGRTLSAPRRGSLGRGAGGFSRNVKGTLWDETAWGRLSPVFPEILRRNERAPDPEAEEIEPAVGGVPTAVGRAEELRAVVPGTAAGDTLIAL